MVNSWGRGRVGVRLRQSVTHCTVVGVLTGSLAIVHSVRSKITPPSSIPRTSR
jgi:hypothetical protein